MKKITLAVCLSLISLVGLSQFNGEHHCKGEELTKKHYEELGQWDEYQISYQEATQASQGYKNLSKSAGSIPIIFHIVYNNTSDSASYADVLQVYNDLVTDFNNAGTARGGFGFTPFNADIQFCLATREPDGTPLLYPGMIIEQTTKTWFDSDNGEENMMKTAADGSQIWNRDQYLNVWICDITNGANSGTAGYAYRPAGFLPNAQIDGIVLDYNIGLTQNVLTHEVGHYMGLDHPWGGSGGCGNDDGFADTPITDGPSFDHASSCSGNQVQCGVQTQYENFMDYANCTSMFSEDQSNHMNSVLDNLRASLLLSNGCAPSNAPPIAAFTADLGGNPIIIPVGGSINFIDQSLNVDPASNPNWAWTFGGGSGAQAVQNPTAQFNVIGTYTVTMTVTNDFGNDAVTKVGHVEVVPPAVGTACDTLRNYDLSELPDMLFYGLGAGDGFIPGHADYFGNDATIYAEPYSAPTTIEVRRLELFIMNVANNTGAGSMTVRVYGHDGVNNHPDEGNVLDTEVIPFTGLQAGWNEIDLPTPASVTGAFWVGFELTYGTADTIAFGMFDSPRAAGFPNTMKYKIPGLGAGTNDWVVGADVLTPPAPEFSLALDVLMSNGPAPTAVIAMPENQVCVDAVILANGSGSTNTTNYFWYNTDDPITTLYASGTGASFGVNFPFVGDELYILFADGSCMTSTAQESIHIDAAVTATANITNTTCGENNGVITIVSEAGGTGVYEYSLDGTNWVATNIFNNMAPGDYTVYVRTPGSECQTDFQVTVGADPVFTPTVTPNQEICLGGSATITAGGGTGYDWIDGSTSIGSTPSITVTPVTTSQYSCNVTDASGCLVTVYTTVVVKQYEDPGFTANDFCVGAANNATVTGVTGGTFAFNPLPGDGATIVAGTGEIDNEVGGTTYTIEYTTPGVGLFCENTSTVAVTVSPQETSTFTTTDFCVGAANAASITGTTGGTFAFNPLPGDGATINTTTGEITGGVAGTTYTLEYTTAGTCSASETQTVDVIPGDDATFTTTDYCVGSATTPTVTGTAGGTFALNPNPGGGVTINAGTGVISNGVAGATYTVEYTTPAGTCQASSTQTVDVNPQEDASFTTTDFCVGAANAATITGTTGGAFAFNPLPGDGASVNTSTGEITSGVAGTTYTLEYTTAGICSDVQTQTVDVIPGDDATFTTTDYCVGSASTPTVTGTAGGTFALNPNPGGGVTINAGSGVISNGVAGATYTVEYTTPAGTCQATSTQTVNVNNLDDATFTTTDYCEGAANNATITGLAGGSFAFNPVPGDGATINTTNGAITSGIGGTTYTLEYTTPVGACQNTSTQTVSVIVDEDASFNLTDYCTGSPNAASAIATTGGTFTFNIVPGDGATLNGTTGEVTGGVLGTTYSIEYTTPGVGCQNSSVETVTVIGSDDPSFTTTDFCFNSTNNATITGTTGGVFTFTAPPGDGATINGADGEITSGVAGSTYNITYTTPAGVCQANSAENVTVLLLDDASFTTTDYCVGTANSATITGIAGGTFAFNPTGGAAIINPSTGGITNGTAGTTYSIEYTTPASGCQNSSIETVNVLNGDDATFALTNYCEGDVNAASGITTPGGSFAFNTVPGDGATINTTNGAITNGVAGTTYSVDYTTAGGCPTTSTENVTVNNLDDATFTFDAYCFGSTNGASAILTPGGTFSFNTAPGDGATIDNTSGEITNGVAGATYDVSYLTNAVCPASSVVSVQVNNTDDGSFTITDFCVGTPNAASGIVTPGGTFDFTTPPGDGATINNTTGEISNGISGSTYDVTYMTPASGCQGTANNTVTVNNTPTIAGTVTDIQCNGDADGSIDVTITDATPTSITWTNTAQTTEDVSNLTANTYEITVDAGGCVSVQSFTIDEPSVISIDVLDVNDIICNGTYGSASVQTSGGTGTLTADWGGNNPNLLPAGNYTVIVSDDNSCTTQQDFTITEPPVFTVTGVMTEESVSNDGAIDLTVTGGQAPYTYSWSTNETTQDISGLAPGTYTVTVTDALGCSYLLQYEVTSTVGIDEIAMNSATIYPNPFHTQFEIKLKGSFDFVVQDARGKIIQTGSGNNNKLINLEHRETGVYFVRLSQENNFRVIKMIKR
jgi:hypothetical protein